MRISGVIAAFVALSVLGQPAAALLCAVDCGARAEAHHCESGATNDSDSPGPSLSGGVAVCDHSVSVEAALNERIEVLRPAHGLLPVVAVRFRTTLTRDRRHAPQAGAVLPGIPLAAQPLRI